MVNANIIISVAAVAIATMISIVVWMHMKGENTATMTLIEACEGYFGEGGSAGAEEASTENLLNSCDTIRANGWDWDTAIGCSEDSDSFYTMRGVFDATDRDMAQVNAQKPTLEGGPDVVVSVSNVADYIASSCSGTSRKLFSELESGRELWSIGDLNYGPCSVALAVSFLKSLEP